MSEATAKHSAGLNGRLLGKLAIAVGFPNQCTFMSDKRPYSIDGVQGRYVMHFMKWFINHYMEEFTMINDFEVAKMNAIFKELQYTREEPRTTFVLMLE
jgi:hypothetical protein